MVIYKRVYKNGRLKWDNLVLHGVGVNSVIVDKKTGKIFHKLAPRQKKVHCNFKVNTVQNFWMKKKF